MKKENSLWKIFLSFFKIGAFTFGGYAMIPLIQAEAVVNFAAVSGSLRLLRRHGAVLACKKVHPIVIICLSAILGVAAGILGV